MARGVRLGRPAATAGSHAPSGDETQTAGFPNIRIGKPPDIMLHTVSREQLEMLQSQKRDHLYEVAFLAAGAAIGALVGFVEAVAHVWNDEPVGLYGLTHIVIFVVSAAVAITCGTMAAARGKRSNSILDEIRKQHA